MGRSGIRNPGNRSPNGLSCGNSDVRITLVDEILTTAGNTALTTGANVAGIETASRTGGAATANADSFFFQAEAGIRAHCVTGVQTCALPIFRGKAINVGKLPQSDLAAHD